MNHSPSITDLLHHTTLYADDRHYDIVHFPLNEREKALQLLDFGQSRFSTFIQDKDEITVIVAAESWAVFANKPSDVEVSADWRLITFDIILKHNLIGFMAVISECLAGVGVSLFVLSAYERDHILTPADGFDKAWNALNSLIKDA